MPLHWNKHEPEPTSIDKLPDFRSDRDKLDSKLSLHNYEHAAIAHAERWAFNTINIAGAWVDVYPRTENEAVNEVWDEDTAPTYFGAFRLKGYFPPKPLAYSLTKWGVDAQVDFNIVFPRSQIYKLLGDRMLRTGDVVEVPHGSLINQAKYWKVNGMQETGNFRFRWLYLTCSLSNLPDDTSLRVVDDQFPFRKDR